MSLKVIDVGNIMEEHVPSKFKESYDNVGLMLGDNNCEVSSILVALDCTLSVIDEAIRKNCNLILTHHPLLFKRPSNITTDTLLGKKIIRLIQNEINVYSSHTNLDSAKGGINDIVAGLLDLMNCETIEPSKVREDNDKISGIGRIGYVSEPLTLIELCDKVKMCLNVPYLRFCGNEAKLIKKLAVINGSGQSYFESAKNMGADCIITGDTSYHYVSDFSEEGIAVIDAGHFGTEWAGIEVFSRWLKNAIEFKGFKNSVLLSETNKDPYKYK
ncbi:Nif3-like dinuclear metal center hexameric protein [Clostridium fermenticellae]|uniref:GTP cyclohydrolase 1 type 2 homolog n=1 Tax=Clostridium fermenticellae TaxID=2068654 RepID=A0A386H5S1_9CLOT|nr:Nif3-like dinuclear metal center hexameric protein [Clostridium fermenticellae]AYD40964.1 Nif3-like dinuclear metal center hexameric protein [Clostridium fermenticellae]